MLQRLTIQEGDPHQKRSLQYDVFTAPQNKGWESGGSEDMGTRDMSIQIQPCMEPITIHRSWYFLTSVLLKYLRLFFHFRANQTTPAWATSGIPWDAVTTYLFWELFELTSELALQLEKQINLSILMLKAQLSRMPSKMMQMCNYKSSWHSYEFLISKVSWSLANAL